uniref:Uncharacterized protein n=1 Tax=Utricularia reniformis TaxID=192314 RepID=A0A1Y0B0A7_9LAMI|nr:hypothetical protein AEK19_MT0591 [Utricularia reniformis]ART30847.1 hypothetical protein AEK19_MT0591 [Utricularia reniformis]
MTVSEILAMESEPVANQDQSWIAPIIQYMKDGLTMLAKQGVSKIKPSSIQLLMGIYTGRCLVEPYSSVLIQTEG